MKAVGYVRVSTEDQNLGPEVQRVAIASYCEAKGYELVQFCTDHGVSGAAAVERRPGFMAALGVIRDYDEPGVLIVMKRDRLARDVVTAAIAEKLLKDSGGTIETTDGVGNGDSPEDMLLRTIVDAFAQYERALIRARTTAALAAKKARGERTGAVPFGFRDSEGQLIEDPGEQKAISRVYQLRERGLSLNAIVEHMNDNAHLYPPRGNRWHRTTVHRLLQSARQTGGVDHPPQ